MSDTSYALIQKQKPCNWNYLFNYFQKQGFYYLLILFSTLLMLSD